MLEILTLLIIGTLCVALIAFCVAIDKAGDMQDDDKAITLYTYIL